MNALHDFKKKQKFTLLKQLDHKVIDYRPFRKDFYDEDTKVSELPVLTVDMLRYALHNH